MITFLERYQRGECNEVWQDLMMLGDRVRREPFYTDALNVARETMRRARANIQLLIDRLETIGYHFGYDWAAPYLVDDIRREPPLLGEPLPDIQTRIIRLEEVGAILPISLRAFYEIVGAVNFIGVRTSIMDTFEFGMEAISEEEEEDLTNRVDEEIDPLYVAEFDEEFTPEEFQAIRQEDDEAAYSLVVTQDVPAKYFMSGAGALVTEVPNCYADAQLFFEDGDTMTLVEYLRYNFRHGGLPSSSDAPILTEKTLQYLTKDLLPI